MDVARQTDDEQEKLWNGVAGRSWVEAQELLDRLFKPFEGLLVEAVSAASVSRVLDVGCHKLNLHLQPTVLEDRCQHTTWSRQ